MAVAEQSKTVGAAQKAAGFNYSVVVPVFNSAATIAEVLRRTAAAFESRNWRYEIIAVNDGSNDASWRILQECAESNNHITVIDLVRNSGQHAALLCGLKHSQGDYVITIDDDLQNPPEEIFKLILRACAGYDLVCGKYPQKRHSFSRRIGSKLVGLLNEKIFGKPREFALTNFRLLSRPLVHRICAYRTAFPYINGLAIKYAAKSSNVIVEHHERQSGKSTYTLPRILKLVCTILFNYSSYPLSAVCAIGLMVSLMSFALGAAIIVKRVILGTAVPGWASIVVLLAFFNGILTLLLGMLGEYVIRILNTVSQVDCYEVGEVFKVE